MQTFRNKIKNLDNKVIFLYFFISMISLKTAYSLRNQIYDSGYHFLFVFFLIIPLFGYFMIFMLRLVYQLEGPPRSPFYLLKYSFYFMILCVTSLPFFYLWGMRDLIYHLKW
jgi:ABC-type dipeptide/oligopeptide/nickel transport system permease component